MNTRFAVMDLALRAMPPFNAPPLDLGPKAWHAASAPTISFPKFLELPTEIQILIWKLAIIGVGDDYIHLVRPIPVWWFFGIIPFHNKSIRYLGPDRYIRIVGPWSGNSFYACALWYRSGWARIMNTCLMSQLMVMEVLQNEVKKKHWWFSSYEEAERIFDVLDEMIGVLDAKLKGLEPKVVLFTPEQQLEIAARHLEVLCRGEGRI